MTAKLTARRGLWSRFGRRTVCYLANNRRHVVYEWVELPLVDERDAVAMTFAVGELFKPQHVSP